VEREAVHLIGELTGFCLSALANDKAMSMGKATELEVAGNGKFP
jgi:hypothetical protein